MAWHGMACRAGPCDAMTTRSQNCIKNVQSQVLRIACRAVPCYAMPCDVMSCLTSFLIQNLRNMQVLPTPCTLCQPPTTSCKCNGRHRRVHKKNHTHLREGLSQEGEGLGGLFHDLADGVEDRVRDGGYQEHVDHLQGTNTQSSRVQSSPVQPRQHTHKHVYHTSKYVFNKKQRNHTNRQQVFRNQQTHHTVQQHSIINISMLTQNE